MFKFLTAVVLCFSMQSLWAMDQSLDFSVKNIIRSKLWYEGISMKTNDSNQEQEFAGSQSETAQMPEELKIALEQYNF